MTLRLPCLSSRFPSINDTRFRSGVAVKDADGDNKADLIAGSGEGSPGNVRLYLSKNVTTSGEPGTSQDISVLGGGVHSSGVFVG